MFRHLNSHRDCYSVSSALFVLPCSQSGELSRNPRPHFRRFGCTPQPMLLISVSHPNPQSRGARICALIALGALCLISCEAPCRGCLHSHRYCLPQNAAGCITSTNGMNRTTMPRQGHGVRGRATDTRRGALLYPLRTRQGQFFPIYTRLHTFPSPSTPQRLTRHKFLLPYTRH